ncbi:hypothetical protein HPB48_012753 [Haemaphysalis longicornis]|uniref:S-phase kinase-associated protein 1 n=1 Tax=Haemaphysalis longicornis TaxID=44386 RepID=A0A9J6G3B6_HAELO|nr:hypothetical protein HPB48_012753 [Haemaphysalis longicornis]
MAVVRLQSCDGVVFSVDLQVALVSGTIKTMLEDMGMLNGGGGEEEIVPLPNVRSEILQKVIEWATYHKDDPPPLPDDDESKLDETGRLRTDDIGDWDAAFLKVDLSTIFELLMTSNYLQMKGLLEVVSKTIANMIKGKTPEQIRQTFNIVNDFLINDDEPVPKKMRLDDAFGC